MKDALADLGLETLQGLERNLLARVIERAKAGDGHAIDLLDKHIQEAKKLTRLDRPGRHRRLTQEVADALVQAISDGASNNIACALVGVGRSTFYRWMQEAEKQAEILTADAIAAGREPDDWEPEPGSPLELRDRIARAKAELHQRLVGDLLHQSNTGATKATTWLLEQRFPAEYPRVARVEMTGPGGGAMVVRHDLLDMSPEQLAALAGSEGED